MLFPAMGINFRPRCCSDLSYGPQVGSVFSCRSQVPGAVLHGIRNCGIERGQNIPTQPAPTKPGRSLLFVLSQKFNNTIREHRLTSIETPLDSFARFNITANETPTQQSVRMASRLRTAPTKQLAAGVQSLRAISLSSERRTGRLACSPLQPRKRLMLS